MAKKVLVVAFIIFLLLSYIPKKAEAQGDNVILDAHVINADEVVNRDGLRVQRIEVEILRGDYKGNVKELQVPLETAFSRELKIGDRIKVNVTYIGDQEIFQFYDYSRSRNYFWIFVLFIILVSVFVGSKGLKSLIPSIIFIALLVLGIIPNIFLKFDLLSVAFMLIGITSLITAWFRLKDRILSLIVAFSVIISVTVSFTIFLGFSQVSYIIPFIGSIATVEEEVYRNVLDVVLISVLIIPIGGVINASIQVAKHLKENDKGYLTSSVKNMLKEGLKLGQRITAGELNNLILMIIGISLGGMYLVKMQNEDMLVWDNGWVALQVIYTISAGLSVLLIAPVTVLTTSGVGAFLNRVKRSRPGNRQLRIEHIRRVRSSKK